MLTDPKTAPPLDEPLAASAPVAERLAAELCRRDPETGQTCAWYHGTWQYLRLLGLVSAPDRHADFFFAALRRAARAGHRRVLVSGSADYAMFAHVLRAYRREAADLDVTIVDRCPTPLALCDWYGAVVAHGVRTQACDILDFESDEPFDLICTHSFLGQFDRARRSELAAKWRRLLRPGGLVVTTNRVVAEGGGSIRGFTAEQAATFREQVAVEARRQAVLSVGPEELGRRAGLYAKSMRSHPNPTSREIVDLLEGAELSLDEIRFRELPGRLSNAAGGPSTSRAARFAEVVARRV